MQLPAVIACWMFLRVTRSPDPAARSLLLPGFLVGLASIFKQVAAVNWIFFVVAAPWLFAGDRRARRSWRFASWSALGLLGVWAVVVLYFRARGGLSAMFDAVFTHNLQYVEAVPFEIRMKLLASTSSALVRPQLLVWLAALAGTVLAWVDERRKGIFLLGWLIAGAVGVSAGGHYFPHYFQQLVPALAVACGVAVEKAVRRVPRPVPREIGRAVLTVVLLAPLASTLVSFWAEPTPEAVIRRIYPGNSFDIMPRVAGEIEKITGPGETVFVFGAEPEVLFYSRRLSASRYIFLFPLYGPFREAGKRQQEVIEELIRSKPGAVLYWPNALFFAEGADQRLTRWVQQWLARAYERHAVIRADADGRRHLVRVGDPEAIEVRGRDLGILFRRRGERHPVGGS